MKPNIIIGITDCSKYENYRKWIESVPGVSAVKLSHHDSNLADIANCDGILLTGGEDVHPRFYHREDLVSKCHEIDEARDKFEYSVLDYTEKNQLPLLGICRGLQVANVYFGGSLLAHIPDYGKFDHSKQGTQDRYHQVKIDPNSRLSRWVGAVEGEINSAHHQAADRIGEGLIANALSPDGVVEGLEKQSPDDERYLLLVQWHPERMNDPSSILSEKVRASFIEAVRTSKVGV